MITPSPATYDDLGTTTYDMLYTYDDPMRSQRIADAMEYATVVRDGPSAAVSWTEAGDVVDGLETEIARDHFDRPGLEAQTLNSNPTFEVTASPWTGANGASIARDTALPHDGVGCLQIAPNGATSNPIAQAEEIAVIPGRKYSFSAWIRVAAAGTANRDLGIVWYDASHAFLANAYTAYGAVPGVWMFCQGSAVAPATAAYGVLTTRGNGVLAGTDLWRIDEAKMIGSPFVANGLGVTNLPVPGYAWSGSSSAFSQDGENAVITPLATNAIYIQRLPGMPAQIDFDLAIKVRAAQFLTGNRGSIYLIARYQDTSNYLRFRIDFNTDQIIGYGAESIAGGSSTLIASGLMTGPYHSTDEWYWLRAQGAGSTIRLKAWTDGQWQADDWNATFFDNVYFGSPGQVGIAAALISGNTNTLPYQAFYVAEFFSGVNNVLDVNRVSTSMSLDDGLPQGATDTTNSGVADMTADLGSPVGTQDRVYWSTFRTDQVYGDIPRDIAGVAISSGMVTADGIRTARLFTGQMADTPVNGRQVQLKGISRNRLRMTEPIQAPAVNGPYEGCEATWPISYALFKSKVYIAPPPIRGCRMYIPFHGSTHPMVPDTNGPSWPYGVRKFASPSTSVWVRPSFVDGPFVAGLECSMQPGDTRSWSTNVGTANFAPGDDFWSKRAAKGRIELWIRGDPTDRAASENNTETVLFSANICQADQGRYIMLAVGCPDRRPYFQVSDGVNGGFMRLDPIPSDGKWHYLAASWNLSATGQNFRLVLDGQLANSNFSSLSNANLPSTDTVDQLQTKSYLSISEFRVTSGPFGPNAQAPWVRDIPFNSGAIIRRSQVELEGLAESTPTEAYSCINGYAQADLAKTGFNERDQFVYLPPSYWVEAQQQVEQETLTPDTNLDPGFTPVRDVNRVYNKVIVNYKASSVQQNNIKILESSEVLVIPKHSTITVVFSTSEQVIQPRDYAWAVRDGTTHAANPPNQYDYVNYVTANTAQDGTGTYATTTTLKVDTVAWDPGSLTIRFTNNIDADFYLSNNVNLPVIGAGGRVLRVSDDSFEAQNSYSVIQRNTRTLEVSAPTIQRRADAGELAKELVARLGQPRIRWTAKVFANPERTPGRLVRVQDPDNTGIDRLFRIVGVQTSQEGHKIDQVVSAQESLPVLVWGIGTWGETVWGKDPE